MGQPSPFRKKCHEWFKNFSMILEKASPGGDSRQTNIPPKLLGPPGLSEPEAVDDGGSMRSMATSCEDCWTARSGGASFRIRTASVSRATSPVASRAASKGAAPPKPRSLPPLCVPHDKLSIPLPVPTVATGSQPLWPACLHMYTWPLSVPVARSPLLTS